jgi:hypothetical protein
MSTSTSNDITPTDSSLSPFFSQTPSCVNTETTNAAAVVLGTYSGVITIVTVILVIIFVVVILRKNKELKANRNKVKDSSESDIMETSHDNSGQNTLEETTNNSQLPLPLATDNQDRPPSMVFPSVGKSTGLWQSAHESDIMETSHDNSGQNSLEETTSISHWIRSPLTFFQNITRNISSKSLTKHTYRRISSNEEDVDEPQLKSEPDLLQVRFAIGEECENENSDTKSNSDYDD